MEETKGIIHSRIYPARDVVESVWYNISGAILSGFCFSGYESVQLLYFYACFPVEIQLSNPTHLLLLLQIRI